MSALLFVIGINFFGIRSFTGAVSIAQRLLEAALGGEQRRRRLPAVEHDRGDVRGGGRLLLRSPRGALAVQPRRYLGRGGVAGDGRRRRAGARRAGGELLPPGGGHFRRGSGGDCAPLLRGVPAVAGGGGGRSRGGGGFVRGGAGIVKRRRREMDGGFGGSVGRAVQAARGCDPSAAYARPRFALPPSKPFSPRKLVVQFNYLSKPKYITILFMLFFFFF